MATETVTTYAKNPNYGQPGEPEMLPPTETQITVPDPLPRVMSKTEFNKFGWAQIGMAAFQKAIEAARAFPGTTDTAYSVRGVAEQYGAALTFAKSEVEALGGLLASPGVDILTADQFKRLTGDNWPTD